MSVCGHITKGERKTASSSAIFHVSKTQEGNMLHYGSVLWHYIIHSIFTLDISVLQCFELFLKQCCIISGSNTDIYYMFHLAVKDFNLNSFNILDLIKSSCWGLHKWEPLQKTYSICINLTENFRHHPPCVFNSWCCVPLLPLSFFVSRRWIFEK